MKRSLLLISLFCFSLMGACGGGSTSPNQPAAPVIDASTQPPAGTVGINYPTFVFSATGGAAPLSWTESGSLPPGLALSSGGVLSGRPTVAGTFLIAVMVQDSLSQSATPQNFTIQVALSAQSSGFSSTGSMQSGRLGHASTLLSNGQVLVTGGVDDTRNALATADIFDPAGGDFTPTGSMAMPRASHTATLLGNGKVLVTGGANTTSAELFDPASGTFAPAGDMSTVRSQHTASVLKNGKVLVAGGTDSNNNVLATAELFDPATATFAPTGSMKTARAGHAATILTNGKVLIAGGTDSGNLSIAEAELFDPVTGTFTSTGNMKTERAGHTATILSDGRVLVTGGTDAGNNTLISTELYDPATGQFTLSGNMTSARGQHTATLLHDNKVLLAGGANLNLLNCGINCITQVPLSIGTAELFDPANSTFTPTGSLVTIRSGHTATLLATGDVVIIGGLKSEVLGRQVTSKVLSTAEIFH